MRNWHPHRLQWQEKNSKFCELFTSQVLMLQATLNALCCSRRVSEWGGKANQKGSQLDSTNRKPPVPSKHLQIRSRFRFGNYRILHIFFWSELCPCHPLSLKPHETFRAEPKSLLRADAAEIREQQLFRTAEPGRKATER